MKPNKQKLKLKIDYLDKQIKSLQNKLNEILWQRSKYQQFYDKVEISDYDN